MTAVPTIAAVAYLAFFAQPAYETEMKLIVRESQSASAAPVPGLTAGLLGMGSGKSLEDALILEDYLHSAAFIELAADRFNLRDHFHHAPLDPFRRLAENAPRETFYQYFRNAVSISVIPDSTIITVRVRAFSPDLAHELAEFAIERSETMINDLNERVVSAQTSVAQEELEQRQEQLLEVREKLLQFQIANAMVDPAGETRAYFSNIAALDSRLVEKRTELRTGGQYLQDNAFELRRLRQDIQAIEEQRQVETRLLVTEEGSSMATTVQAYEKLKMEQDFALSAYSSAFALAERTKSDAARQQKFLLTIAPPHTPEKPVFPQPARGGLTVFVLSCLGYGIFRLILATIRDHSI